MLTLMKVHMSKGCFLGRSSNNMCLGLFFGLVFVFLFRLVKLFGLFVFSLHLVCKCTINQVVPTCTHSVFILVDYEVLGLLCADKCESEHCFDDIEVNRLHVPT